MCVLCECVFSFLIFFSRLFYFFKFSFNRQYLWKFSMIYWCSFTQQIDLRSEFGQNKKNIPNKISDLVSHDTQWFRVLQCSNRMIFHETVIQRQKQAAVIAVPVWNASHRSQCWQPNGYGKTHTPTNQKRNQQICWTRLMPRMFHCVPCIICDVSVYMQCNCEIECFFLSLRFGCCFFSVSKLFSMSIYIMFAFFPLANMWISIRCVIQFTKILLWNVRLVNETLLNEKRASIES